MSDIGTGESDTLGLPIQFQGIFHGEKFKLGKYTGLHGYESKADSKIDSAILSKADSKIDSAILTEPETELPEWVRGIFFAGVKKVSPKISGAKELDEMYREFSDWLMERRDRFVLECVQGIMSEELRHLNFWSGGIATVYAILGEKEYDLSVSAEKRMSAGN